MPASQDGAVKGNPRTGRDRIAHALAAHRKGKAGRTLSATADAARARQDRAARKLAKMAAAGIPVAAPKDVAVLADPSHILALGPAEAVRARLAQIAAMQRTGPRRDDEGNPLPAQMFIALPGVSALSMAVRYLEGGITRFLEFVQLAVLNGGTHAAKWWQVYADLTPTERREAVLDDVCCAAGVKPYELMAEVVASGMQFGQDVGNLIASSMSPEVIAQMAKSATRIDDVRFAETSQKDRHVFLQSVGFAPASKPGIAVQVSANASAASAAAADPSVPPFLKAAKAAHAARTVVQDAQLQLPVRAASAPSDFAAAMQASRDLEGVVVRRGDEERAGVRETA